MINVRQHIENNGILDKWMSGDYVMAIEVLAEPYDVVVCPARGLVAARLFLRQVDETFEFDETDPPQIFMIKQDVWIKMRDENAMQQKPIEE